VSIPASPFEVALPPVPVPPLPVPWVPDPELDGALASPPICMLLPLDDDGALVPDGDVLELRDVSLPQPAIGKPTEIATAQRSTLKTRR
jgi:hypothetical protein